jgi:hypothetical protein
MCPHLAQQKTFLFNSTREKTEFIIFHKYKYFPKSDNKIEIAQIKELQVKKERIIDRVIW